MSTLLRALFVALLAALVVTTGMAGGCADYNSQSVRGSGVVASQPREAAGFTHVRLAGSGDVILEQTGAESVTVEAEDNLLPLLEATVHDGVLRLGAKPGVSIQTTKPIRYHVTVKALSGINITGSGNVRATGLDTDRLSTDISGSGSADLTGRADDVDLRITGSGSCDAADLRCKSARVTVSGSGTATVDATDRLTADVTGSGSVHYTGNPAVEKRITGSGAVTRR